MPFDRQSQRPDKAGESQTPARPNNPNSLGIGADNFESVFVRHRHDGTIAGGSMLTGPYFIFDANGTKWKLVVSTAGSISAVKA